MPPKTVEELFQKNEFAKPTKYACTIVSLLPYSITETKPHMVPFTFLINQAEPGIGFGITHIEEATHTVPNPFDEKLNLRQFTPPNEMARSLVDDYTSSMIGTDEFARPGLFWVEGRLTVEDIKKYHKELLDEYKQRQVRWFRNIILMADADWEKTHNILAVSDLQRHAARFLDERRAWVDPIKTIENTCPFCKAVVDPTSVKCFNCKEVINIEAYNKMKAELGVA